MATSPEFEAWWKTTNLAERRDAWQGWQANEARHADLLAALEQIASVCVIPGPGQRPIPTPEARMARAALDKVRTAS